MSKTSKVKGKTNAALTRDTLADRLGPQQEQAERSQSQRTAGDENHDASEILVATVTVGHFRSKGQVFINHKTVRALRSYLHALGRLIRLHQLNGHAGRNLVEKTHHAEDESAAFLKRSFCQ